MLFAQLPFLILSLLKKTKINSKKIKILLHLFDLKNKDILEYLSKNNRHRPRIVVGFSAETENLNKNSILKMRKKNCDLIIANDVSKKDKGFNSDYNEVSIIDSDGNTKIIKKNKKSLIANKVAEVILDKLLIDDRNFN